MSSPLLLPGEPGFVEILATPPPDPGKQYAYIVRPGSGGIPELATVGELDEYLNSGEYDERLDEIGQEESNAIPINQKLHSDVLYLPKSIKIG